MELESALQAHGDHLATELRLLNELPQVYLTEKCCVFDRGNGRIANKRGAICCLLCCGKQLDQKRAMTSRTRGRAPLWSMPSDFSEPRWRRVME